MFFFFLPFCFVYTIPKNIEMFPDTRNLFFCPKVPIDFYFCHSFIRFCFPETEEGFLMLFSRRLGFAEDIEPAEEVRTEIQSTQNQEEMGDDGSPEVKDIRHLMKVLVWNISSRGSWGTHIWTASSEFGAYRLCKQRRFRRACTSAQSHQNLRCSLIQAVSQEEPSDRKPDPWPLWMAGHAQLKFVMTECSKIQIRLTGLIWNWYICAIVCLKIGVFQSWSK